MAFKNHRKNHGYRVRKHERMLARLSEVQFMTLPSAIPGKTFNACNVMLDRGEVDYLKHIIEEARDRRREEGSPAREIHDAVNIAITASRKRKEERRAIRLARDEGANNG